MNSQIPLSAERRAVAEDATGAGRGSRLERWRHVGGLDIASVNWGPELDGLGDQESSVGIDGDTSAIDDAILEVDPGTEAGADATVNQHAELGDEPLEEHAMRNGLYAVVLTQGGSAPVLRVGWFQRAEGDEWRVWWTTPYREEYATKLSTVWANGPTAAPTWTWGPLLESDVTRLHFVPLARLDPGQWAAVAPRPADFAG